MNKLIKDKLVMKFTEFIKELVKSRSGYSSKRFSALILVVSSILIPIISMFISNPMGSIDESVLILSAQLLISACGLLGFTMKENIVNKTSKNKNNESKMN